MVQNLDLPIVQNQGTTPDRSDPSVAAVALPDDDSSSLAALLAGVGALSTIGNLAEDEDLTDESYITSSVMSSVLNFDRL